jgi:hypothetical protein
MFEKTWAPKPIPETYVLTPAVSEVAGVDKKSLARVGRQRTAPAAAQRPRAGHRQQVAAHHPRARQVRPRVPRQGLRPAGDPAVARQGVRAADPAGRRRSRGPTAARTRRRRPRPRRRRRRRPLPRRRPPRRRPPTARAEGSPSGRSATQRESPRRARPGGAKVVVLTHPGLDRPRASAGLAARETRDDGGRPRAMATTCRYVHVEECGLARRSRAAMGAR